MFELGDIIALKTHPFFEKVQDIRISADANLISPIMVVVETLEKIIGEEKILEKVKCQYYSHKKNKILEHWFSVNEIKIIEQNKVEYTEEDNFFFQILNSTSTNDFYTFKNIILKSVDFELEKKKASLNYLAEGQPKKTITASLSFLPPIMTILKVEKDKRTRGENGVEKQTSKENETLVRKFSKNTFKCRWYNPEINSFSESFISPYAFKEILPFQENIIYEISDLINEKKFLKLKDRIIFPIKFYFNHYKYQLEYYDFLECKNVTKNLDSILEYTSCDGYIKLDKNKEMLCAPIFSYKNSIFQSVEEFVENTSHAGSTFKKDLYRIHYKDRGENSTVRTIKDCEIFEKDFIKAHCMLRNAKRIFRIEGINKIELLDF